MYDKLLKIKTSGRDDSNADQYRYPYEPTPYEVLERLANSGYISKKDVVLLSVRRVHILSHDCGRTRVLDEIDCRDLFQGRINVKIF